MPVNNHNEIIIRYFDNSITSEEKIILREWLKESEEHRTYFHEIRDIWLTTNALYTDNLETEIALHAFRRRIQEQVPSLKPEKHVRNTRKIFYKAARVAALVVLTVGISYFFMRVNPIQQQSLIVNQLITAEGSKGRFVLPDGTEVWLNSNSVLKYPDAFTGSYREVELAGEAYFKVTKDTLNPFLVSAGDMKVKVLGTSFLVQNYTHKDAIEMVLVEGKVETVCSGQTFISEPGQLISYSKANDSLATTTVDTSFYTDWINNRMVFDNDKLEDILIGMEKWYGTTFVCNDATLRKSKISFTIENEPLDEILNALSYILPIKYSWNNDVVQIAFK